MFTLPDLPYPFEALEPVISARTLHFHHDKHQAAYVKTVNELLAKVDGGDKHEPLEGVVRAAAAAGDKKLFNNAAQIWNHTFFWASMSPRREPPSVDLAAAIAKGFGDLAGLKTAFVTEGAGHFGSGWVWLVAGRGGDLTIRATHDADDTLTQDGTMPLLVCDLWEHAYYLDHQNDRKGFLEAWFDALPNWTLAGAQLAAARAGAPGWRHPPAG